MTTKNVICPSCHSKIPCEGKPGEKIKLSCPNCKRKGVIEFPAEFKELDYYPLNEPFTYAKILKNTDTLEKFYKVIEPRLSENEQKSLDFLWETLMKSLNIGLDEVESKKINNYLVEQIDRAIDKSEIKMDEVTKKKIIYNIERESIGLGKIDPLMKDPNIEDISCDGANVDFFIPQEIWLC